MIRLFKNIRRQLASENKVMSYFHYAIREIFLVAIGILIAVQVNNWNEQRNQCANELHYLANIKKELHLNIAEIYKNLFMILHSKLLKKNKN